LNSQALGNRGYYEAWRLQALTDLTKLPDYEKGYRYYGGEDVGAPVDVEGNPVFYDVPESWEAAKSDGERWRWALSEAGKTSEELRKTTLHSYANFQYAIRHAVDGRTVLVRRVSRR
jgi:hypothetical protein